MTKIIHGCNQVRPNLIGCFSRTRAIEAYALQWCSGKGIDFGYGDRTSWPGDVEYILPGALGVDRGVLNINGWDFRHADITHRNLPPYLSELDFIFSSHALEHIEDWRETLQHWTSRLCINGILFLYLPHIVVPEWQPENYSEHKWSPTVEVLRPEMEKNKLEVVEYLDGYDAEGSFYIVGKKTG